MKINTKRLYNQIVLVTGAWGFTGSHCVEALIKNKMKVVAAYRHESHFSYMSTIRNVKKHIKLVQCDFKNVNQVRNLFNKSKIDYVIHFAAQGSIPRNEANILEMIESNIMGTANLLETARRYGKIKGLLFASSDKAYGKSKKTFIETDPVGGDHPYEVSKSSSDLLARSYNVTFGLPVVVVRATNLYGPGDAHIERIIPSIMRAILTKHPLVLRSRGNFLRDYLYVDDVVDAYILLLSKFSDVTGEVFNVSSKDTYTVLTLISKIEKILNKKIKVQIVDSAKNEIPYLHLSSKKIEKLGWKQKTSIEEGIQLTYKWYKKYISNL